MSRPFFCARDYGKFTVSGIGKKLVDEATRFLSSWRVDLRARRDYRNLIDADAVQDITADIGNVHVAVAGVAYTAEQADREAIELLEKAKVGGLDASDLPLIERALRNIQRSAEGDHTISEALKA